MLALLGGLGAALAFATSMLASTRSSRLIGAASTVGWVMVIGLPFAVIAALVDARGVAVDVLPWLAVAGLGNIAGLGLEYTALRMGRVGVIAPLVSTEGAIAAIIAILAGATFTAALLAALALVVAGGALTAASADSAPMAGAASGSRGLLVALGLAAAVAFGASLYATAHIGQSLPAGWAVLAPRVAGVALVTAPLAARGRLQLTRPVVPLVVIAGLAEVIGFFCIAIGARADIAVTSVISSQFAALAVLGAVFVFGERLQPVQRVGVVAVAIGTALVGLLS